MKKWIFVFFVCIMALTSCQSAESRVESAAETFLNGYYSADYQMVLGVCTADFRERLRSFMPGLADIPDTLEGKIKEALSRTSFKIVSTELDKDAGTALVSYELTVPHLEKPVPKRLRLKIEGRTALVDGIE